MKCACLCSCYCGVGIMMCACTCRYDDVCMFMLLLLWCRYYDGRVYMYEGCCVLVYVAVIGAYVF